MELTPVSLRRLLTPRAATELLQEFLSLVPDTMVSLLEADGSIFVETAHGTGAEASRQMEDQAIPPADYAQPLWVASKRVGVLKASGPGLSRPGSRIALQFLHHVLSLLLARALTGRALSQETLERYREINLLYNIGETISTCLDPDEIPHLVLEEAARVIRADTGAVLLDEEGVLVIRSGFGEEGHPAALYATTGPFLAEVLQGGQPCIFTADQLISQVTPLEAVLCAPLKAREQVLGAVLLGRLRGKLIFTASDEKLLTALSSQAAIAIENARLFADVRQQRDAIAAIKNHMDNIFASIASGVITTNREDSVTTLNRAAERILGIAAQDTMGRPYIEALPEVGLEIAPLVDTVKEQDTAVMGYELSPVLPRRGPVVLRLHLSPLKDNQKNTTGIAIVADDLTEHRQLQKRVRQVRETFEQYVAPRVVEKLLSDPSSVRLGGARREITTLYADIRKFTVFSEQATPEVLIEVLNRHLTLAAEAVLAEEGTLDKFVGDAAMAIFNAPLSQPDHAMRAVRAALAMQRAIAEMHARVAPAERLSFGVGIATGPAVVGNIGSTAIHNYTAIGDSVNQAWRLQGQARAGQVLLTASTYERVREQVNAQELGHVEVKGYGEPILVFELLGLKE